MCDCPGGVSPDPVFEHGDEICRACGVVISTHEIDDRPEWYGAEDARGAPDANDGGPETVIDFGKGGNGPAAGGVSRRVLAAASGSGDPGVTALREGFRVVSSMARSLGFSGDGGALAAAKELFRDMNAVQTVRSDARDAFAAAAMYLGCKICEAARELSTVAAVCGVDPKALTAAVGVFKDKLSDRPYFRDMTRGITPGHLINVYVDKLRLPPDQARCVKREAYRINELTVSKMDCSRTPKTLCSGLVCVALRRQFIHIPKKQILVACGISPQTMDKVVAEISRML